MIVFYIDVRRTTPPHYAALPMEDNVALALLIALGLPEEGEGRLHPTALLKALHVLTPDLASLPCTELADRAWPVQEAMVRLGVEPSTVARVVGNMIALAMSAAKREEPIAWGAYDRLFGGPTKQATDPGV